MVARPGQTDRLTLVETYREAVQRGLLDNFWKRRWGKAAEYAGWLSEAGLSLLSPEQAAVLYRASGGNHSREFKTNSIEEVRDSLDFLLYDTIKLEGRFDECVSPDGAYKLAGAGKEYASYLLCLRDPALFGNWNTAAEKALRVLGMYPGTMMKGHWGMRYLDLLEALQRVRLQFGLADFRDVDRFAYWLARSPGAAKM